ncbi:acetyltransferase [Apibacter sp. HY039]|uniref:acetyltransferase n=1 Tax=Apibacter sp. HY039 TaxID=2501476 RepID=UPI000FEBCD92|nr:acetyltransferase [Apibacter sp. HY039]
MLIVGAKGFAKELLEICHQNNELKNLVFFDDVNKNNEILYGKFPILKSTDAALEYFKNIDHRFALGLGNPILRKKFTDKLTSIGGQITSLISKDSKVGSYGVEIGEGANILDGVKISNDVIIGKGSIIYYNSIITHDVVIGDFVEISPDVKILGRAKIGNNCQLGSGTIVLPDITIGNNVITGAGAVITKNLPDNCTAVGVPSRILNK